MKSLNRLAVMIGFALLFSSCYATEAAGPRKHRHHRHHPKRGVVVVHRLASTHQVHTDSSTFNFSLALADRPYNNDHT